MGEQIDDDIYRDMPILEAETYDDVPNHNNQEGEGTKNKKTKARFYRDKTHQNPLRRQLIGDDPLLSKKLDENKFNGEYYSCLDASQMKTGQYKGLYIVIL